jgi:hypothetical protein
MRSLMLALGLSLAATAPFYAAESRDDMVRNDRAKHAASGLWSYNDLAQGFADAQQSGKPLLIVLRCVP